MNALGIEHATLTAWPAHVRVNQFGWEFCATRGCSGRVNSIWPLAWTGESSVGFAIAHAVRWCGQNSIDPCFRLSDGLIRPAELPLMLAQAGFAPQQETLVMTRPLPRSLAPAKAPLSNPDPSMLVPERVEAGARTDVELLEAPDETIWAPMRAASPSGEDFAERQDIVSRIGAPRVFARASLKGRSAAIGMGVVTNDLVGLYLMRTAPDARRRGLAREIVGALLDWGATRGAAMAYLQVEKDNDAAVALYQSAGFTSAYAYWYWRLA